MNSLEEFLKSNKTAKEFLKENGGSKGCVMLDLGNGDRVELYDLRLSIPIENIYSHKPINILTNIHDQIIGGSNSEQEDLGYEQEEHCTVFYGLNNDSDLFIIKRFVNDNYPQPFILKTSHLHIFENVEEGECDCLVLKCQPCKELEMINQWIKQMFPNTQTYNEYVPHITLAYIKKGTCKEFLNKSINIEFQCSVKDFIYSGHDKVLMEEIIETLDLGDQVEHRTYGIGRVISIRDNNEYRVKYKEYTVLSSIKDLKLIKKSSINRS